MRVIVALQLSPEGAAMRAFLKRFAQDEGGATAIEYGLIIALVGIVIVTAVTTIGTKLVPTFTKAGAKLG
jgi:pilus assembly protein Flp/PilA